MTAGEGINMATCQIVTNDDAIVNYNAEPIFCGAYATDVLDLTAYRDAFGVGEVMLPDMPVCARHKEEDELEHEQWS